MNTHNPTPLSLGMEGKIDGRNLRISSRVVFSALDEDGETYVWNEFHLGDEGGRMDSLLSHEMEDGRPVWRFFQEVVPPRPMTVAEAARVREKTFIDMPEGRAVVTFVGQSQVAFVAGPPPPGITLGEVEDYFIAKGDRGVLWVVCWAGGTLEYYKGRTVSGPWVAQTFGVSMVESHPDYSHPSGSARKDPYNWIKLILVPVILVVVFCFSFARSNGPSRPASPPKIYAETSPLAQGAKGELEGDTYRVAANAVVEVGRLRERREHHEYLLISPHGAKALLVRHLEGSVGKWQLFFATEVPPGMTPLQAATITQGEKVAVKDEIFTVGPLCGMKARVGELETSGTWPGEPACGFMARSGEDWLMARWNAKKVWYFLGRDLPESEVLKAFLTK